MGSCFSVQKTKRPLMGASSHKEKPLNVGSTFKVVGSNFGLKSSDFGSKEEMFFDSRACLDSDCEDDFFSVNGDFTPSRGVSPNNQTSTFLRAKSDKTSAFDKFPDSKSGPSPTVRRKFGDLLQETPQPIASNKKLETNREQDSSSQKKSEQPSDILNSVRSSEFSPSGDLKNRKKAGRKVARCCLPSLAHRFSFSKRRQKRNPVNCSA